MCASMADIQSATAEIRLGKKRRKKKKKKKPIPQGDHNELVTQNCYKHAC